MEVFKKHKHNLIILKKLRNCMAATIRTLWNVLSVFLITAIVVLFRSIFVFREEADRIGIKYNSFEDIYQMLYALFIIISVRSVATVLL